MNPTDIVRGLLRFFVLPNQLRDPDLHREAANIYRAAINFVGEATVANGACTYRELD